MPILNDRIFQLKGVLRQGYQFQNREAIILRDYLAMERTRLASERTFMAYIRTSLFFLTGGLTLLQFERFAHLDWLGYISLTLSVVLLLSGIIRYIRVNRRLRIYYEQIKLEQERLTLAKEADARKTEEKETAAREAAEGKT
jgi:putative membrane protein